ncbi:GNAT superfamily N-acetyltransferase [Saccharothrix tamanrassetensis]|uniref:GNAT superfamily N-acetyltransferase n=1 Tax=Saccharothrix tamanrassetensis TaxID=1051531 RepID=A0A841CCC1_9PSEU|nr:GNAT family N-acetyltransferase [Saccharothrix tamanrassetensis]MBB5953655.1 GNAT superfamily N-acetyltransferase [Saccharothrix tamanrassetensis]
MTSHASPRTDAAIADLVRRWARGWQACRGWETPQETGGGLCFALGLPGRHSEVFALRADDDPDSLPVLAREVAARTEPTWLTVPTSRPEDVERTLRAAGLRVRDTREAFMIRDLADHPAPGAAAPYRCVTTGDGRVLTAEVRHESGQVAASGLAALVGEDAIADKIETHPDHRRRGLGSVVMGALAAGAAARGARTGILLASADGQRLYTALGWTTRSAVVMATGPERPAA